MALARIPSHDPNGPIDIAAFSAGITGTVIRPEDAAFETARQVHNRVYDRRPSLIVKAASSADVARTVIFAREHDLEIAVRGGSHSLAGHSTTDGGIVLDLSAMKGLHIDAERKLAWAQPGLTAGEYTVAAAAHGLATPFGDSPSVGIGGLTLGGGIGWLVRKYGLTIDALVGVDVVTADGRLVTANATENSDLFWAVRGGGGNFGVVTRFQFRLYPVEETLLGMLLLPPTREVLQSLVPIAASAPEELSTISFLMAGAARAVRSRGGPGPARPRGDVRLRRGSGRRASPRSSRSSRSRRRSPRWSRRSRTRPSTNSRRKPDRRRPARRVRCSSNAR